MTRKHCEDNERIKRQYMSYLKQAKGQDQKTLDKVAAALVKFELSTNFKPFKKFHIDQAGKFKTFLEKQRHPKTGKELSHATTDATLRVVKGLFHWLAGQSGYKSRISYADVEYFNNNRKKARIAHAQRDVAFPSMEQALHAFQGMPDRTDFEKRDKALLAFFMLTGARDGAVASLKLKHINLFDGCVYQDARDVNTKNSKTFQTYFFPVDRVYLECFTAWFDYLRKEKLFSDGDALFPKAEQQFVDGYFNYDKLSRENYADASAIRDIVRGAFTSVQLPPYTPHLFRKTLAMLSNDLCDTMEQMKAWSMNLGHENISTTVSAYMPVSTQRQGEVIKGFTKGSSE
jgi:integrase